MPRKNKNLKKQQKLDFKYQNPLVGKFINIIMQKGKKSIAEKIVYSSFSIIYSKTKEDPFKSFIKAVEKTSPLVEVRSKRVGGASYQVPVEVKYERSVALSFRWIKKSAMTKLKYKMEQNLANEIIDATKNRGEAIKKRENMHKMAEANKAFAHYLW